MAVRVHEPCSACQLQELTGYLASVQSDWNVVKRGYYAHVLGEADNKFTDPVEALKVLKVMSYAKHILLQFFRVCPTCKGCDNPGIRTMMADASLWFPVQKPKNGKPVSDQWVPAFVITDDKDQPVGSIQVPLCSQNDYPLHSSVCGQWRLEAMPKRSIAKTNGVI